MGMKIKTPAKINHFLFVGEKREDGYHEIFSLMTKVSLFDIMNIELIPGIRLSLFCKGCTGIPRNENIVYKTWEIMCKKLGEPFGVSVNIEKNIPIQSGLAGGSSNSAAFIRAVNILLDKPFNETDLETIALEAGSDVPFFVKPGSFIVQGRGEQLTTYKQSIGYKILVIVPDLAISTKWAYDNVKINLTEEIKTNILNSLRRGGVAEASTLFDNSFRPLLEKHNSVFGEYRQKLLEKGAVYALPSGSGSAVIGVFEDEKAVEAAVSDFESCRYFVVDIVDDLEFL